MFTFIFAMSIGVYFSRRVNVISQDGLTDVAFNHDRVKNDAIAFFTLIGSIALWTIGAGRKTRKYFDGSVLPWLQEHGVRVSLPSIGVRSIVQSEL